MIVVTPPIPPSEEALPPRRPFLVWCAVVLGVIVVVLGLAVAAGGVWLILLGGSWYYLFAGIGLIACGGLAMARREAGAWTYLAIWLSTLAWAYWEVGFDGWALGPRVVAPTVILFVVLAGFLTFGPVVARRRVRRGFAAAALLVGALFVIGGLLRFSAPVPLVAGDDTVAAMSSAKGPVPAAGQDWPAYGGSAQATRYSSLGKITFRSSPSLPDHER